MQKYLFSLAFVAIFTLATPLHADQLVMRNGDIITGKITKLTQSKVTIKPKYSGKFEVDIAQVVSLTTDTTLEITTQDGEVLAAQIKGMKEDQLLLLVDDESIPVPREAMLEAAPPRKFYARESNVDGLVTINKGNTKSRSAVVNFDTRLRLGDHRQYLKATVRRDEQNDVSTKKQNLLRYEYDWIFSKPWYLGLSGDYERDPIRALSHRSTIGILLGRDLINNEKTFVTAKLGVGYSDEKLGGIPESGTVGLWEFFLEHDFGKADVFHNHGINYQNYGSNNMIVKSNTGFKIDVFRQVYAKVSYRYDYESEPAAGKAGTDSTLAIGLGAKF